ncbi:hypothetical protein Tco_0642719 [Tanacetum coccineum]
MFQQKLFDYTGTPSAMCQIEVHGFTSVSGKGLQKAWGSRLKWPGNGMIYWSSGVLLHKTVGFASIKCALSRCCMGAKLKEAQTLQKSVSDRHRKSMRNKDDPFCQNILWEDIIPEAGRHGRPRSSTGFYPLFCHDPVVLSFSAGIMVSIRDDLFFKREKIF